MQSQLPKEEIEQEDLIYKRATQQLKEHQQVRVVEEGNDSDDVPFREFYKNVRSNISFEEEIEVEESQPENVIKSYIEKLSDGLEPESELQEPELQTDPEKLGKFKKYFIKEEAEEPKSEIKVEESVPAKLTLKEKLELKKKQAMQPPIVAAIQLKQEEEKPEPSVAKTTLMKKIEEFKKLKQQKESEEQSQIPQATEKKQEIPAPPNALRKLLNEKAQQKTQQIAMTQEIEQNENNQKKEESEIQFNENTDFVSDEPVEIDLNQDESHQEYFAIDSQSIDTNGESQKETEINNDQSQSTQNDEVISIEENDDNIKLTDESQINDQNQIEASEQPANNNEEELSDEKTESEIPITQQEQNQQDPSPQISQIPTDQVADNQIDNQIENQMQDEVQEQDQEQVQQFDEPQTEITDQNTNEQVNESVEPQKGYESVTQPEEKTELIVQDPEQQNEQITQVEESNEIKQIDQPDSVQNEAPSYQGYVEEHNVEVNDYLSEIDEAEKLQKIRQVEQEIEQKEVLKEQLEEQKRQEELRLQNLQIQQQKLTEEENQQEQKIEEVSKEIDLEEKQLQNIEAENVVNDEGAQEHQEPDQQFKETNQEQSNEFHDDESQNGFSIDDYNQQQLQQQKVESEGTYSQSNPLFKNDEYTTQVGEGEDAVVEISQPAQLEEVDVDMSTLDTQVQLSKEILVTAIDNNEQSLEETSLEDSKITESTQEASDNSENIGDLQVNTDDSLTLTQDSLTEQNEQVEEDHKNEDSLEPQSQDQLENGLNKEEQDQVESADEGPLKYDITTNETSDDVSATPMMIVQDEQIQEQKEQIPDPEIQDDQVDIVQLDDYNQDSEQEEKQPENPTNEPPQLTTESINTISQIQSGMKMDDTIAIDHIEFEHKVQLVNQNKRTNMLVQVQEQDYDEEVFQELNVKQHRQQKQKKQERQKVIKERESKLVEQQKQAKILEQQQQEVLRQQQQLIDLQNQQLLNKQKYKKRQVTPDQKVQQNQIQMINQELDQEFSFQQIVTKVDREVDKHKRLRGNSKHAKFADINFFQLTEKQQTHNFQSQDLFEAIKSEMLDCDVNQQTESLCDLCQTDVVYEINDDNWYLIGIAYGLKRHFQNLLNTIQFHFKNAKIYTSFNKQSQVCVTLGDTIDISNLEEILSYYNNSTLPFSTSFAKVPQKLRASFAQMKVDLNQHKFIDFSMEAAITTRESYNGFTITEQHVKVSNSLNYTQIGSIQYPGAVVPYRMHLETNTEELQVDLNGQVYERVLANYLSKSLLGKVQIANVITSTFLVRDNDDTLEFEITIQK